MKKRKYLILCAMLVTMTVFAVGCGNNGAGNNGNGTEAPYEDETNRKVNEGQNDTNNGGTVEGDLERSGDSLKDAGRNLMDSVEETGDALRDGIDNLGNDINGTNNTNNNTTNNGNVNNANNANNAGGTNMNR